MQVKKSYVWILISLVALILVWVVFYVTNPLRHSITIEEFESTMKHMPGECRYSMSRMSVPFDNKRFPMWERGHIMWLQMLNDRHNTVISGRRFFSDWYVFGKEQEVLSVIVSGVGDQVCLLTIEPPKEYGQRNEQCLKILQQQFTYLVHIAKSKRVDVPPSYE